MPMEEAKLMKRWLRWSKFEVIRAEVLLHFCNWNGGSEFQETKSRIMEDLTFTFREP